MKSIIISLFILLTIASAEKKIEFPMTDHKHERLTEAIVGLHRIPQHNVGTPVEPVMEDLYTPEEWLNRWYLEMMQKEVDRYNRKRHMDTLQEEEWVIPPVPATLEAGAGPHRSKQ